MLDEREDKILANILAQLSEHFPSYAVVVLSEELGNDLHYDYSNWRIGRMLFHDSLEDMTTETGFDGIWEETDEGDGWKDEE